MRPIQEALERLHAAISADPAGVFRPEHVAGLSGHHQDALHEHFAALGEPWATFEHAVQRVFEESEGDRRAFVSTFAQDDRIGGSFGDGARAVAAEEIRRAAALGPVIAELNAAWSAFGAAGDELSRLDGARWVMHSARQLARLGKMDGLRRASGWLLQDANRGRIARRAVALVYALFGPAVFRDADGAPCCRRAEIAETHGFTDRRMRDFLRELADCGLSADDDGGL